MGNEIYFMGIDIGTYTGKGVITDSHGKVAARAEIAHGMENPAPGFYEHDAEAVWWHDFCFLSNSLIKKSRNQSGADKSRGSQRPWSGLPARGQRLPSAAQGNIIWD